MASEIRVNKINSRTGVGTITLSPTGVDFTGIATVATLKATTGIVTTLSVTGTTTLNGNLDLQDNDKILIGTGDDLEIYHDGSNSYIKEDGTGSLKIQGTNLHIESATGEAFVMCTADGAVDLYYDNSKKLETKTDGVDITGELQCDTLDVDGNIDLDGSKITFDSGGNVLKWADNVAAYFGDGSDLRIYHDGSNSWITENGTGSLKIRSTAGSVQILGTTSNDNMAVFTVDGASELYYDNSKKFETTSTGVKIDNSSTTDMILFDVGGTNFARLGHNSASGTDILDVRSEGHTRFLTNGNNERLRITSGGNIGINNTSPGGRLSITHTLNSAYATTSRNNNFLQVRNDSTTSGCYAGIEIAAQGAGNDSITQLTTIDTGSGNTDFVIGLRSGSNFTEKARFRNGGGITFNGDTAAANALADYEEGTWTPAIAFGGNAVGVTYTVAQGFYTKIGKVVHCNGNMTLSNAGSSTGGVTITGLPFTVDDNMPNTSLEGGGLFMFQNGMSGTTYGSMTLLGNNGQTTASVYRANATNGEMAGASKSNIDNDFDCRFMITYYV